MLWCFLTEEIFFALCDPIRNGAFDFARPRAMSCILPRQHSTRKVLIKRGSTVKRPSSVASWTGFCCRRNCVVLSPHGRKDLLLCAILASVSERRGSLPSVALRSRARARMTARPPARSPSGTWQVWIGCWMDPQARVICPTLPRRSRLISPCPRCDGMMRCGHASASMSRTARRSSLSRAVACMRFHFRPHPVMLECAFRSIIS